MTEPVADIPSLPRPVQPRPWWTGGQYSLVRALLGTGLATWFVDVALGAPVGTGAGSVAAVGLALTGALAAILFAAGIGDHASAVTAIAAGVLLTSAGLAAPGAGGLAITGVLLAHLATPPAPHGSWAARGRPDPSVDWAPGRGWWHAVWVVLALAQIDAALRAFAGAPAAGVDPGRVITGALAIALPVAALIPRLRAGVFLGAGVLMVGRLLGALAGGVAGASAAATPCAATGAVAFLVALLFGFDPAWVPGRRGGTPAILFYDGACGLCHRAVRFVVVEDPRGENFRFAPLQSGLFKQRLDDAQRRDLPDSLVVLTADGRILTRAASVVFILGALGGWWTIAARLGGLVPRAAGDALYDVVAKGRRRWFAAPAGVCPVISPSLRQRFDDQGQEAGRKAVP
jgi:predicted DCC family thiol-disulfide oxidoreductase YuxK